MVAEYHAILNESRKLMYKVKENSTFYMNWMSCEIAVLDPWSPVVFCQYIPAATKVILPASPILLALKNMNTS